jgi:hypothetical protein
MRSRAPEVPTLEIRCLYTVFNDNKKCMGRDQSNMPKGTLIWEFASDSFNGVTLKLLLACSLSTFESLLQLAFCTNLSHSAVPVFSQPLHGSKGIKEGTNACISRRHGE